MSDPEKCLWCGEPAEFWCDAIIGVQAVECVRDKVGRVAQLIGGATIWTCDAPMCAKHRHGMGMMFGEVADTIDHCPHHYNQDKERFRDIIMFQDESESKRSKIHAEARRSALFLVR